MRLQFLARLLSNKKRRLACRKSPFFLRVPGLEPGAVYRPDVPNSYKKSQLWHILSQMGLPICSQRLQFLARLYKDENCYLMLFCIEKRKASHLP